jgi:hypothetical protein
VILFRPAANVTPEDLQALRDAGFVPVVVEDFNDVKVIDPFTLDSKNAVWRAAIDAILKADAIEGVKTRFGRRLAELLHEMAVPTGNVKK